MKSFVGFVQRSDWVLVAVLLLGLVLRFWGIGFGLPYTVAPDEPTHFDIGLHIFETGDLNPHWLNYPSLMFYINALALVPFYLIGRLTGAFATPADIPAPEIVTMGVGRLALPSEFLLSRSITAIFGLGCVLLVYLIGQNLSDHKWVARIAALFLAISPAAVYNSHLIRPDTLAVFFALVSLWWAMRILDSDSIWNYIGAGLAAGFAVSSKYNMAPIVLPLVAAHLLRHGALGLKRKELVLGLVASAVGFLATTPYSVLDYPTFVQQFTGAVSNQVTGHAGTEGSTVSWYLSFLWTNEGILAIAGAIQGARLAVSRSKRGLVLLSFPLVYYGFINLFIVRNDRTILPVLPFFHLLAAMFVVDLFGWITQTVRLKSRVAFVPMAAVIALMIAWPLQTALASDQLLLATDGRDAARDWLNANLPPGSRVAEESYTPYLDTRRFVVQGVTAMIDHPIDWYVQNGFEYLVFSQGMYARFYERPDLYGPWIDEYNRFFDHFAQVKSFDENGYEIRVYRTDSVLPSHRVAARYGDKGEIVELVGYDDAVQNWIPGAPLAVKLFWRTLADKSEPLAVNLKLFDKDERQVASTGGDLFQGRGWPEGIFTTDWTIPAPVEAAPGTYHLEVHVVQTRFDYDTPAKVWAGDDFGKVALGPFRLTPITPSPIELKAARLANILFGGQISLLGYSANTEAKAGESISLSLYWQARVKLARDYTVFVHLLDASGSVRSQIDSPPLGGSYPTSIWDDGEILRDDYVLQLPADLAPGTYRVELGLYDYPSLVRLPAADEDGHALGDHWVLSDPIQVR